MKQLLIACISVTCLFTVCHAQEQAVKPAKNFPGVLAGIEWNTISGMKGVEYERIVLTRATVTMGVKGSYLFRYKQGNMSIFGTSCCERASIATALGTVDIFTGSNNLPAGFFLHAAFGMGMKSYLWEPDGRMVNFYPAVDAGLGWMFSLGSGTSIKWTNTITFPSKDGGITITRLAFGF